METPRVLPTKCPVCGAAWRSFHPWSDDEPETVTYKCEGEINGFVNEVEWVEDCAGLIRAAKTDQAWDAAYEQTQSTMAVWADQKSRELEISRAGRSALEQDGGAE